MHCSIDLQIPYALLPGLANLCFVFYGLYGLPLNFLGLRGIGLVQRTINQIYGLN